MLDAIRSILRLKPDHILLEGLPLPAGHLRLCGKAVADDQSYLRTARAEASRLVEKCDCTTGSAVLDIGCGHGRLAVGLISVVGAVNYLGLDVDRSVIKWCRKRFRRWPSYKFEHIDVLNQRYHSDGSRINDSFRFPLPDAICDIIFLFSVFSHMEENEMRIYLHDFSRLLRPGGRVLFTTFVEEDVPPFSVNPDGYIFEKCSGPLHIVRYERSHLMRIIEEVGFDVVHFGHRTEIDSQSVIILARR